MSYLLLAVLSALWGTSFLLIKIAVEGLDPLTFAFCRLSIGAVTLAALAGVFRWRWPRTREAWGYLLLLAVAGQALPVFVSGAAARLTTSADLALMMGAAPIATMLIARVLGMGEVWSLGAAFGLGLGLVGVGFAVGAPVDALRYPDAEYGRALGLLAAVLFAVGALASRFASRRVGTQMAAAASMAMSSTLMGCVWLGVEGTRGPLQIAGAPWLSLAAVLTLGCVNTAFGYLVYFRLVETAGATFATLNNYAVPVIGLLLGALVLGEPVTLRSCLGLGLVIVSVVITGNAARRA